MLEQRPYQQRIISKAVTAYREENATSVMIESPPGCLSGDTEVVFNIGFANVDVEEKPASPQNPIARKSKQQEFHLIS